MPTKAIFTKDTVFESCGIVASSPGMLNSSLGRDIDSNEFVIRFNAAPTKGHEEDVGTKTSLRIINSVIFCQEQFDFFNNEIYDDVPLLYKPAPCKIGQMFKNAWEHCKITHVIKECKLRGRDLHLLSPWVGGQITEWLQRFTPYKIPVVVQPSSGFLTLAVAMLHCKKVNVYGMVPSWRERMMAKQSEYTLYYYGNKVRNHFDAYCR